MQKTIASYDDFVSMLSPELTASNKKKLDALKFYFEKKRIIRVIEKENDFPQLVYPTKKRIKFLIKEKKALLNSFLKKKSDWQKKLFDARNYHLLHSIKKFSSPIYWKHLRKQLLDPEYKGDAAKVKLPVHLVSDPRWKPMVKMFIENYDYRKQLVETVENSIIYKKNKRVARYADSLKDFRMNESEKRIQELEEKISLLEEEIAAMKELMSWIQG